jgi:gluconate 2-dehydrogenase gamma chain
LFTTLRRHCIQGCFADPRWGGNKNKVMWRGIGYLQPAEDLYP